jgi:nucleoid-associated protein YgaU
MVTLGRRLRLTVTLAAVAAAGLGSWRGCASVREAAVQPHATLADVLAGAASLTLTAALGWLGLVTLLLALETCAGRELTGLAGCPHVVRRALVTICGVALTGAAIVTPAQAHEDHSSAPPSRLDGLPLPDRTAGRELRPAAAPRTVVVRRGDTLWAIAAGRLSPGAAPAAVDRAWRSLYRANRAAIGGDPDLIRVGTELRLPPATEEENR